MQAQDLKPSTQLYHCLKLSTIAVGRAPLLIHVKMLMFHYLTLVQEMKT